eukprot:gene2207-19423_t
MGRGVWRLPTAAAAAVVTILGAAAQKLDWVQTKATWHTGWSSGACAFMNTKPGAAASMDQLGTSLSQQLIGHPAKPKGSWGARIAAIPDASIGGDIYKGLDSLLKPGDQKNQPGGAPLNTDDPASYNKNAGWVWAEYRIVNCPNPNQLPITVRMEGNSDNMVIRILNVAGAAAVWLLEFQTGADTWKPMKVFVGSAWRRLHEGGEGWSDAQPPYTLRITSFDGHQIEFELPTTMCKNNDCGTRKYKDMQGVSSLKDLGNIPESEYAIAKCTCINFDCPTKNEKDCLGICGGSAKEDCMGTCQGTKTKCCTAWRPDTWNSQPWHTTDWAAGTVVQCGRCDVPGGTQNSNYGCCKA